MPRDAVEPLPVPGHRPVPAGCGRIIGDPLNDTGNIRSRVNPIELAVSITVEIEAARYRGPRAGEQPVLPSQRTPRSERSAISLSISSVELIGGSES